MVITRNRSRQNASALETMELPARAPRRARLAKGKARPLVDDEGSETVESSTPTPDSSSPSLGSIDNDHEIEAPHKSLGAERLSKGTEGDCGKSIEAELQDQDQDRDQENYENEHEDSDAEEDKEGESEDEGEADSNDPTSDSDADSDLDSNSDEEDLEELLIKAQASLKRKAMFEEKKEEPRFNFPKLETGLDGKDIYIKQDGVRAKVDMSSVVVVDKGSPGSKSKSALETCEINMNAEKVHISKKQKKEEREKTTGKSWFDLPQQVMTPELKRDLQILKLRNVLDPKRFYKREEKGKPKFPKYFQVGTIIEGNTEFYSSRLTKKERATTITGEVMKDLTGRDYYKRKFDEIQEVKQSGGKRFNKKGKGKQSKSWRAGK
ncbi:hypothetical protein KVV02_006115 [Mortierella alpina]|uniref:Fcf2 pre-rRNA processing C-terminal domain-containing protein n=1 Tax=Mortierella alpina TaxID=64518 RepID=A0A9P7ZW82_MORAP|nr:hypothetical protein KVV02_006115 [Mortierella alpina]